MKRNRMSFLHRTFLVTLLFLAFHTVASAGPILWTLSGANFNQFGSGSVNGSFVFDPDTDTFDLVNLVSGSTTYSWVGSNSTSSLLVAEANPGGANGDPAVFLYFASSLTDAGGPVSLLDSSVGTCLSSCGALADSGVGNVGDVTGVPAGRAWELSGVNFDVFGSGGVTGLFTFDAGTDTYDFVDLVSGSTTYSYAAPESTSSFLVAEANPGEANGDPAVFLYFAGSLADGGPVSVTNASAGTCLSSCSVLADSGVGNVGQVSQPFVPEPGSFALQGIGLIVLTAFLRFRRRAKLVIV